METNKQPTSKAMKTPKFHFLAMIIPPAALLLSDCSTTSSTLPQAFGSRASPALYREKVSSRSAIDNAFEIIYSREQSEIPENGSSWFMPLNPTFNEAEDPDAVQITPLVVTGTALTDVTIVDWPCDVVDAEVKASLICPKETDTSRRHATEDSVSEWMRSLR
jgi:hypothetical protein